MEWAAGVRHGLMRRSEQGTRGRVTELTSMTAGTVVGCASKLGEGKPVSADDLLPTKGLVCYSTTYNKPDLEFY